jgi:hypothetical protein
MAADVKKTILHPGKGMQEVLALLVLRKHHVFLMHCSQASASNNDICPSIFSDSAGTVAVEILPSQSSLIEIAPFFIKAKFPG